MLSIIIPVFNQANCTKACLEALAETCGQPESYEIIIVDNCSFDKTPELIEFFKRKSLFDITYIRNDSNLGFTIGSNQGAAAAKGDTFVFLNNDTIVQPGWREKLENALGFPDIGIVGPRLLSPQSLEVNHAGYVYNPKIGGFYAIYQGYPGDFSGVLKQRTFQALLGACLMMQRSTFEKLAGFSEGGLEDIDLCLRAGEAGFKVLYIPSAVVLHHGSVTLNNSAPGSMPVYTDTVFSEHWKGRGLKWDDFNYYIEDAVLPAGDPLAVTRSFDLLNAAMILQRQKSPQRAVEVLKESLKLYPGNTDAIGELILLTLDNGDVRTAEILGLELFQQGANFGSALMFGIMVFKKLGMEEHLRQGLRQIEELKWCSSEIRAFARESA